MAQSEAQRLRNVLGAHALHSKYDSRELTRKARESFLDRFEKAVDPAGVLDPKERERRAAHARKAYFLRLSLLSVKARRERENHG